MDLKSTSRSKDERFDFYAMDTNQGLLVMQVGCRDHSIESEVQILRGEIKVIDPILLQWRYGSRLRDFLESDGYIKIVSSRVVEILSSRVFTGWESFTLMVQGKDGQLIPHYYGLSIHGRCGRVQETGGPEVWVRNPDSRRNDGYWFKRRGIKLSDWDGSDLFCPEGYKGILVARRVMEALVEEKITNVCFIPIVSI